MVKDILGLTLRVGADRALRRFTSYADTSSFRVLQDIKKDSDFPGQLAAAFRGIYGETVEQRQLERIIKDILSRIDKMLRDENPIPWHLRELMHALSQVRGYSKYRITYKACKDHLFFALFGAKKADQKKIGKEHETWELIPRPFFLVAPPPKNLREREKVRGLADTIFFLAPQLREHKDNSKALLNVLSWFKIDLECTTVSFKPDTQTFELQIEPGVDAPSSPTVKQKCISLAPSKLILLSSPNVVNAVENLSEIWRNPTAKIALISAATGSGKEVLKDLLADAIRIEKNRRMEFALPAIESTRDLEYKIAEKLGKKPSQQLLVFLDEVHHPGLAKARYGLLRLIEADTLSTEEGVIQSKNILFVLAASKRFDELRGLDPPDLWTRIEYPVDLKHPLLVSHEKADGRMKSREAILREREEILKDYFTFFWYRQVEAWRESTPLPHVHRLLQDLERDDQLIKALSDGIVKELRVRFSSLISIRTIRSITKILLGEAEHSVRLGKKIVPRSRETKAWVNKACTTLIPEIAPQGLF